MSQRIFTIGKFSGMSDIQGRKLLVKLKGTFTPKRAWYEIFLTIN